MRGRREPAAVRFDLPAAFGGGRAAGLALSPSGGLALIEGADAIRQSLMILLSTRPGERVARPGYGCPLHRLAFEPNDAATAGLAMHYIRTAVRRWEPRVDIVSLDASPAGGGEPPERLQIELIYRVRATDEALSLRFDLDLHGGGEDAVPYS